MKSTSAVLFIIVFILISSVLPYKSVAQENSPKDSVQVIRSNSAQNFAPPKITAPDSTKKRFLRSNQPSDSSKKVEINLSKPVKLEASAGKSVVLANDSLLRWNLYNSFSEFLYWNAGDHHFRTESFIRSSYVLYPAQFEKEWRIDGLVYRNPLGFRPNINFLPYHKTGELGFDYLGDYFIESKRYYQTKPVTILEADETDNGYLSVYGHFFAPIKKNQHLELSLWNRGEDGAYANAETQAKNMSAHYRYQFSDSTQLEFQLDYVTAQLEEPDGYRVEPLASLNYDLFATQPVRQQSRSSFRDTRYRLDYLRTFAKSFRRTTVFLTQQRRLAYAQPSSDLTIPFTQPVLADSTNWNVSQLGFQTDINFKFWILQNSISLTQSLFSSNQQAFSMPTETSLMNLNWNETEILIKNETRSWGIDFKTGRSIVYNSLLGFSGKTITHLSFKTGNHTFIGHYFSKLRQQPLYTRYLNTFLIQGKKLSSMYHLGIGLEWIYRFNEHHSFFMQAFGSYKSGDYGFTGSTFFKSNPYWSFTGTFRYTANFFILNFSNQTNITHFEGAFDFWPNQLMVLNRSRLYYESYIFSKAAFIKTGFSLALSPLSYATPRYQIITGDWFQADENFQIHSYAKLDYELSARVRSIFFYIRWENLTQGFFQQGYMETYPYPMFPRRLRFGIKTFFFN